MVRMQGDMAKPPEQRLNYKHCFDALYRVRVDHRVLFLICHLAAPCRWSAKKVFLRLHAVSGLMSSVRSS